MAGASVVFTIGGVDVTPWVQILDVVVEDGYGARGKVARGPIVVDTEAIGEVAKPQAGQIFSFTVDGTKEFEGPITVVRTNQINPVVFRANFECVDYTLHLDKYVIQPKTKFLGSALPGGPETLRNRIDRIRTTYAAGFSLSMTGQGPEVRAQEYDYVAPSAAFDELAELHDYTWWPDYNKAINFVTRTEKPAPITAIDLDTELRIGDVGVTEDWSDLHNDLLLKNFVVRSSEAHVETKKSDGSTDFYPLAMEPWSVASTAVDIFDGALWAARSVSQDPIGTEASAPLTGDANSAWVCIINKGIRFPTNDIPPEDSLIRITYSYAKPGYTLWTQDLSSIAEMASREGGDGVHQKVINMPEMRAGTVEDAMAYAEMLLDRGAWPIIYGKFTTTHVSGWESGQTFTLYSAIRDIDDPRNPGSPVRVWIKKVTKQIIQDDNDNYVMRYDVEFSSKPFFSPPIPLDEFLHRLIDRTSKITLPAGEIDARLSPTVTTNAAYPVTIDSATLRGTINANGSDTAAYFLYGLTTSYGTTAYYPDPSLVTGSIDTGVSKLIEGLDADTTYHYRCVGQSAMGTTYGADMTFTTSLPDAPTAVTEAATGISEDGATLNGTVNANNDDATVTFEYGLTPSYGTTVDGVPNTVYGTSDTAVSAVLTGLVLGWTYHYRVKAVNAGGTTYGDDLTLTTVLTGSHVYGQPMFAVGGTLAVSADAAPWFQASVPLTLVETRLVVKTAPTVSAIIVNLEHSDDDGATWTSINTNNINPGDRVSEADSVFSVSQIAAGDLLRIAITQVGSGTPGADLSYHVKVYQ